MGDTATFRIAARRVPSGLARRMWAAMVGQAARTPPCPSLPRLDGRLAILTGATGGIGAEIARGLARRGAELILPCRDQQRGRATLEALRREFGTSCVVHLVVLELSDLETVAPAVGAIARVAAGRAIDLLVENGGVWPTAYTRSAPGPRDRLRRQRAVALCAASPPGGGGAAAASADRRGDRRHLRARVRMHPGLRLARRVRRHACVRPQQAGERLDRVRACAPAAPRMRCLSPSATRTFAMVERNAAHGTCGAATNRQSTSGSASALSGS